MSHLEDEASVRLCVYAFMRLWGGLIFLNCFRVVPPPVAGGAARFPSLETVKTVCVQGSLQRIAPVIKLMNHLDAAHARAWCSLLETE